jgi:hypothetical protein
MPYRLTESRTARTLKSFIFDQINADGIVYFIFNYSGCMAHCRNQKRLYDASIDVKNQASVALYVDALYAANDIR